MQPYKISTVKNNFYEFITAAGTKYACYFLSYSEYFEDYKEIAGNVYAFNVEIIVKSKTIDIDARIGFTIVQIIKRFLTQLSNAVVYVCDNIDRRETLRKRKFDMWFKQYDDGTIIKIDGHILYEDVNIYNTILIHKENPKKNKFIEAFIDLNKPRRNK